MWKTWQPRKTSTDVPSWAHGYGSRCRGGSKGTCVSPSPRIARRSTSRRHSLNRRYVTEQPLTNSTPEEDTYDPATEPIYGVDTRDLAEAIPA